VLFTIESNLVPEQLDYSRQHQFVTPPLGSYDLMVDISAAALGEVVDLAVLRGHQKGLELTITPKRRTAGTVAH